MIPTGQNTKPSFTEGFVEIAAKNKYNNVALVAADAEFSNNACDGARENVKKHNLKIVYDRKYPPSTTLHWAGSRPPLSDSMIMPSASRMLGGRRIGARRV